MESAGKQPPSCLRHESLPSSSSSSHFLLLPRLLSSLSVFLCFLPQPCPPMDSIRTSLPGKMNSEPMQRPEFYNLEISGSWDGEFEGPVKLRISLDVGSSPVASHSFSMLIGSYRFNLLPAQSSGFWTPKLRRSFSKRLQHGLYRMIRMRRAQLCLSLTVIPMN